MKKQFLLFASALLLTAYSRNAVASLFEVGGI